MFHSPPPLDAVIDQLIDEDYLDEGSRGIIAQSLHDTNPKPPWFVQIFIAAGAWMAALFLATAVAVLIGSDYGAPYCVSGLMVLAFSIGVSFNKSAERFRIRS